MAETKYTLNDLYRHLFETMADLRADKIEVAKAEAIKNLAQVIVNTGKLECRFIDVAGGHGTGFMPERSPNASGGSRLLNRNF